MEINDNLKKSLQLANTQAIEQIFPKLLENCFAVLSGNQEIHNLNNLYNSKPDVVKEIYATLMSFIVESVRNNATPEIVTQLLQQHCGYSQSKVNYFCELYTKNRQNIEISLVNIGSHLPHITDINWKIDYIIKTANIDESNGPLFRIGLQTEQFDIKQNKKKIEFINFVCTSQELQDLVYKLKDAVRHCQRIASDH